MSQSPYTVKSQEQTFPKIDGDWFSDSVMRTLYATDASAFREMPHSVVIPKTIDDIKKVIDYANKNGLGIIPRAAGTSLAGQVVGNGIVVDISKYFNQIIELNVAEKWVRVQPGVNRDELNMFLAPHNLQFAPETSTANRCRIAGMIGNNSCGSNSVQYGSTREHLIEVNALLADGNLTTFGPITPDEVKLKAEGKNISGALEQRIYSGILNMLSDDGNRQSIADEFPKPEIPRRNTGYAIDLMALQQPFNPTGNLFNFCTLLAGSEGTLAFITEAKLNLVPTKPPVLALVCSHFNTLAESLKANLICLKYKPGAVELIDNFLLECTKNNREQKQNRFFIEGDPGAILVTELSGETREEVEAKANALIAELNQNQFGYHHPILWGTDTNRIWALRKAGLGLLSNVKGDAKPVPVIEDTAVDVNDLPQYIDELDAKLKALRLNVVYYAHAGSGELHIRPVLDLKSEKDTELFRTVLAETAKLVKKYRGSLSGEHGDGRLRGEFIEFMIGEKNFELVKEVKRLWDPNNVFNPNKIVDTPPMNSSLRYKPGQTTPQFETFFDYSDTEGYIRMAEQCNGSGDCRKGHLMGGTMCPSYMATGDEDKTTRARANILREILNNSSKSNPFDSEEIYQVMDLCLSCKGCKNECPSNVDVAKLKAEFLQKYYDANGVSFRTNLIANIANINKLFSNIAWLYNLGAGTPFLRQIINRVVGFHPDRTLPLLAKTTFRAWYQQNKANNFGVKPLRNQNRRVLLMTDEFTNYNDVKVGIATLRLLTGLGYTVELAPNFVSGRAPISKGLLRRAATIAKENVELMAPLVNKNVPLVGIEPSALLSFRDEYPDLLRGSDKKKALELAECTLLLDEFLVREAEAGRISKADFSDDKKKIRLHGHCQQKALVGVLPTKKALSIPANHEVLLIPSGCCGMAGSFGYEAEHYDLSMKVGELVLFPTIRSLDADTIVAASGTSCRHQIKDGTGKTALHPAEILYQALPTNVKSK